MKFLVHFHGGGDFFSKNYFVQRGYHYTHSYSLLLSMQHFPNQKALIIRIIKNKSKKVMEKSGLQCQNAGPLSNTHGHYAVHTNIIHLVAMETERLSQDAVQSEDHKPNSEMKSESPDSYEDSSVQTSLIRNI